MATTSGEEHIVPAIGTKNAVLGLLAVLVLFACADAGPLLLSPTPLPQAPRAAAARFDADAAHRHLEYIADPARKGRLSGSAGYLDAARYVADRFRDIGLEPGGDGGTFFQHFALAVPRLAADPELAVIGPGATSFRFRADFAELVGGLRGGGQVQAPLVYVGGAIDSASYSDFAGVDVQGKAVIVAGPLDGDPAGNAIRHGAVAVLFVARDNPGPLVHYSYLADIAPNAVPTVAVTEPVADRLVASSGRRIADLRGQLERERSLPKRVPLSFDTGLTVRVGVPLAPRTDVDAVNVVGVLRPADQAAEKYVVVGGHLDGVGTDPDGTVYPAANDNASGPAVTIEVARALAAERGKLRDGVIFVAWAGEEEGLRGSAEFLRRAAGTPFAAEHLTAYLNLDVVGCCGTRLAASRDNASLFAALSTAAGKRGVSLASTNGSSDHETFTRAGVPAAIVIWAEIGAIHTTTDTSSVVDAAHLATVGDVTVQAVLDLAGSG